MYNIGVIKIYVRYQSNQTYKSLYQSSNEPGHNDAIRETALPKVIPKCPYFIRSFIFRLMKSIFFLIAIIFELAKIFSEINLKHIFKIDTAKKINFYLREVLNYIF